MGPLADVAAVKEPAAGATQAVVAPFPDEPTLETVDVLADNPRFRDRGATRLTESLALFTRGSQQK